MPDFTRHSAVSLAYGAGGNLKADGVTGAWTALPDRACSRATIINDTGTTIEWRQAYRDDSLSDVTVALPIADNTAFTVEGIRSTAEIEVRRKDLGATPVSVKSRWVR